MFGVFLALFAIAGIVLLSRFRTGPVRHDRYSSPAAGMPALTSSDYLAAAEAQRATTIRENTAAACALGKTIAFILYAVLGLFVVMLLQFVPGYDTLARNARNVVDLTVAIVVEVTLLVLVIRGTLPGSRRVAAPFNERQLAAGATILSLLAWVLVGHTFVGGLFRMIVSFAVILSTAVYFIAKSVLSRSVRGAVLVVAVLPVIELAYEFRILPPPLLRTCQAVLGP